jgi:hypothetical protein
MPTTETIWIVTGFLGQGLFFGRWIVQWLASERSAASKVPISFWYLSLVGGLRHLPQRSGLHRRAEHRRRRLRAQSHADLPPEPTQPFEE